MFKLFRAGKFRRADKSASGQRRRIKRSIEGFGQTKIDYFYNQFLILFSGAHASSQAAFGALAKSVTIILDRFPIGRDEHQVRWLQIAVEQPVLFRNN